jgi:ribonuclease E
MTSSTTSVAPAGEPSPEGDPSLPDAGHLEFGDDLPALPDDPDQAEPPGEGASTALSGEPRRKRRRRGGARRRKRGERASAAGEPERDGVSSDEPPEPAVEQDSRAPAPDGEDGPRRKRRRRRRRRNGRGGENGDAHPDGPVEGAPLEPTDAELDVPAPARDGRGDAPADGERQGKRSRRRRRKRGGRSDAREGPVGVEVIPGESDEISAEDPDELPDLPDEAERVDSDEPAAEGDGRRSRRGRKRGRSAAAREPESDDPPARTARRNVILVNAVDREETRVAVVEDGRINEFQMTVKRHKSLVNDIYRGRVVNLEPAIGAAFIDFGQGRNGFLHTSDVLSAYGEPDWKLEKLLTTKVDPEEWDSEAGPPEAGAELAGPSADPADNGAHDEHHDEPHDDEDEGLELARPAVDVHEESLAEGEELSEVEDAPAEPALALSAPRPRPKDVRRGRGQQRPRARPRLPISDLLKKGDQVVVQVTKDAIGDKGPTLTTYISIPGRYLVLMPSMARTGVSRKIEDEKERRRLKRILESLDVPPGMGVIVRTAGIGCTKAELKRDLDYLMLLWEGFGQRLTLGRGPVALYEESDVAIRTIRDMFTDGTEAVVVDDESVHRRVREFVERLMPENLDRIRLHDGQRPLFHTHGVEQDFERIFSRRLDLPCGGSIVMDQTEALVAIDVNSGKTRSDGFDFEAIALKTNLDAVPEIARQIRLRDLGGIIVIDFIDMLKSSHRRQVERALADALSGDRARSKVGRISQFGLIEMTRQRLGPGLSKMLFANCPRCRGSGRLRTVESRSEAILRRLGAALTLKGFTKVEVRAAPEVIEHLRSHFHATFKDMELRHQRELVLIPSPDQLEDNVLRYLRADGREVRPGGRRKR